MNKEDAEKEVIRLKKRANKNDLKFCPFTQSQCVPKCAMWVKYFVTSRPMSSECTVAGGFCVFTMIGG